MCAPTKLNFLFAKENRLLMLFQSCTKLTFGLSDILVITVLARNRIKSVGSLFFCNSIPRFGKDIPSSLKRLFTPRRKKGQLTSEYIKVPLVTAIRSLLMKEIDRRIKFCNFSVTFITSLSQSSIKSCLMVHLVTL